MSYQVLARKWRPQTFEDITGQEAVTHTLQNAIRSGRIAHAFLFSGIRGVGKTTMARVLAKALNCHEGPTDKPCGACVSCQEIAASSSLDVLEIDAASNRRIDDVRELRESVRYGTARDRFKIFIIDEVHMLTNEAFNALLKTLEEPPSHVKMILATTEHHKIPVTITSRCQQYQFKPIPYSMIFDKLKQIAGNEGIEISDYALRAITAISQGSMRDAQSALDRILAFSSGKVLDEDVRALLGVVDDSRVGSVLGHVIEGDRAGLLRDCQEMGEQGIDPVLFCRKLIDEVRNMLVWKTTGWNDTLLNIPDTEKPRLEEQAGRLSELDLIRFYDALTRTEGELRWNSHPRVHLEITLMKLVELARLPRIETVISQLGSGSVLTASAAAQPKAAPASRPAVRSQEVAPGAGEPMVPEKAPHIPPPGQVPAPAETPAAQPEETRSRVRSVGPNVDHFLAAVQRENISLYFSLEHASEVRLEAGRLTIRFPDDQGTHVTMLGGPRNREFLAGLAARITGTTVQVDVIKESAKAQPQAAADPVANPGVQTFLKHFPGKIMVERKVEN